RTGESKNSPLKLLLQAHDGLPGGEIVGDTIHERYHQEAATAGELLQVRLGGRAGVERLAGIAQLDGDAALVGPDGDADLLVAGTVAVRDGVRKRFAQGEDDVIHRLLRKLGLRQQPADRLSDDAAVGQLDWDGEHDSAITAHYHRLAPLDTLAVVLLSAD